MGRRREEEVAGQEIEIPEPERLEDKKLEEQLEQLEEQPGPSTPRSKVHCPKKREFVLKYFIQFFNIFAITDVVVLSSVC